MPVQLEKEAQPPIRFPVEGQPYEVLAQFSAQVYTGFSFLKVFEHDLYLVAELKRDG